MKLPKISELHPEQEPIYSHPVDVPLLVVGPPGSGKTSMAIWRARLLTDPALNKSVVLVTKNRLLSHVAADLASEDDGRRITTHTMHKLVSTDYSRCIGGTPKGFESYRFDWDDVLAKYEAANISPSYDHMIVDEAQNLPFGFFKWATRFGARVVSIFADEDQSTSEERTRIADFAALGFNRVVPLTINHRTSSEIASVAAFFHQKRTLPPATAFRGQLNDVPRLLRLTNWTDLATTVVGRAANRGEAIGVIVALKREVTSLEALLRAAAAPQKMRIDAFTSDAGPGAESAIRIREPGITVITGESAIGLEFDTLYLQDLGNSLPPSTELDHRRLYMLCARARDSLFLVDGPLKLTDRQINSLPQPPLLDR